MGNDVNEVAAELLARREVAFAKAIRARGIGVERNYIAAIPENKELTGDKSITLSKELWIGSQLPEIGQIIELAQVEEFGKGWRARLGRAVGLKT